MRRPDDKGAGRFAATFRRNSSGVRLRLFAYAVLILVATLVVTVLTVRQILHEQHERSVDDELAQEVKEFQNFADGTDRRTGRALTDTPEKLFRTFFLRNVLSPEERLLAFVDGKPFLGKTPGRWIDRYGLRELSPDLASRFRHPLETQSGALTGPSGETRYTVVPVRSGDRIVGSFVVGYLVDPGKRAIDDAIGTAALIGFAALIVGSLIAYLAAGRVLSPLRELTETARSIESTDLTRRIKVTGHDELSELGETFNAMLSRLEVAFTSQGDLIRHVSHEMRTPITIVRGHLELLAKDPSDQEATIALVTDELDRMSLLVDDLLTLAKAERTDFVQPELVAIYPFVDELMGKARSLGDRKWKITVVGDPGEAMFDRRRLTEAMLDLIDNAVHQTDPGQVIAVGASSDGARLRLWVEDEGPGIESSERERLLRRFERGRSGRRYQGSGLGLAIVRAVAEAHGGRVTIGESRLGGARVVIVLPLEREMTAAPEMVGA